MLKRQPLPYTTNGLGRVFVGLSWDAREDKVKTIDHLIKKDSQHDLDLCCYIYNQKNEFIDFVGAEGSESIDESGKIYHSGDNLSGTGGGDDETISAELNQLPENYKTLIFMVEVGSRHFFDQVKDPTVRLVDGKTNAELSQTNINDEKAVTSAYYVYAALARDPASRTGWSVFLINEYPDIEQVEDWGTYLARYA
ncbi:MAG: hypothetical protein GW903_02600 [Alphaproteobacteria bacterium]|nr:hypothetical protein [Alphaproteobacteria bacterium]NCQ87862.1 hypothetical protein [Alphaproteobacteria bacterium]NCT05630.1 hypothetical protein [Alphaproteobacteria bacterium]